MIDLANIDEATLIARGKYSTLRSAQKNELERLRKVCTDFQSIPNAILKNLQNYYAPIDIADMLTNAKAMLDDFESSAKDLDLIRQQLDEVRGEAWPK